MGGLLRAQEGKERVLSSLRDPSQLDQDPSKTAALNQDRLENVSKEEDLYVAAVGGFPLI